MSKHLLVALVGGSLWLVLTGCASVPGAPAAPSAPSNPASPTSMAAPPVTAAPNPSAPTAAPAQSSAVLVKSDVARVSAPSVSAGDLTALTAGNAAFAFDLYHALGKNGGNLFYSPYSISLALAMTYAGANGQTAQQMASTLHFDLPPARLHPAFDSLDLALAQRSPAQQPKSGKWFRLNVVNALWGQTGYPFLPSFLDLLAANYGAGMRLLDFQKSPDPSRLTINNWVSDQTEGKIKDLLASGTITPMTRLVLTNAIYFNASWDHPFDADATTNGTFATADGQQVTVAMMKQTESFDYAEGTGYQAIELPYDGQQLAMLILLPAKGQFDSFEGSLDAAKLNTILDGATFKRVALSMPKFKYESGFDLTDTLRGLGMTDAFASDKADFSGMTGHRDLYIGAVIHKAYVSVNEKGTEAAAATAVGMAALAMPSQPVAMTIDRPFIFLIRDNATGAILFLGQVTNPAQ